MSEKRLSLVSNGKVRYELETPYRDGATHVIFEPLDFIARLVALVAKPRVNLSRFHGVFAPNRAHRARATPGKRASASGCFDHSAQLASVQREGPVVAVMESFP